MEISKPEFGLSFWKKFFKQWKFTRYGNAVELHLLNFCLSKVVWKYILAGGKNSLYNWVTESWGCLQPACLSRIYLIFIRLADPDCFLCAHPNRYIWQAGSDWAEWLKAQSSRRYFPRCVRQDCSSSHLDGWVGGNQSTLPPRECPATMRMAIFRIEQ